MVFPFKYSINLKSSILRLLHVLPSSNVSASACVSIQAPLYSLCCLHLLILTLCIFKWKISRKPRLFDWYPFFGFDKKPRQSHFHLRPAPHICSSRQQLPEPRRIRRWEKLALAPNWIFAFKLIRAKYLHNSISNSRQRKWCIQFTAVFACYGVAS